MLRAFTKKSEIEEEGKKNHIWVWGKTDAGGLVNSLKPTGDRCLTLRNINISFIWYIGRLYWVRDGCSAIIFVKHFKTVSIQVLSLYTKQCGCINCCFVVKAPANAIMQHKPQTMPTWTKPILTCFTKLIAVQPSMAKYEWTMYQIKVD